MNYLKNLALASLLVFSIVACSDSDDDNKSSNPPVNTDEIITSEFTAKLGSEAKNTITFKNPFNMATSLNVSINNNLDKSFTIDKNLSTCEFENDKYIGTNLSKGASCDLVYTYKPTEFDTKLLSLNVEYLGDMKSVCPTSHTVPTYEQILARQKFITMNVYNYTENSNGEKSPAYVDVNIDTEWAASNYNAKNYSQNFTMQAKKGEYSFPTILDTTLKSDNDDNCAISNNILTVKNVNGCSLTVTTTSYYPSTIKFTPKQESNPYYNVAVNINNKYTYSVILPDWTLNAEYYASQTEKTYFTVVMLDNDEKITNYEITGENASKFQVAATKHNSCDIAGKEISIPEGQKNCFFTVDIKDKSENGWNFKADLTTTLSSGSTNTYKIEGEVNNATINDNLKNVCQSVWTEDKQQSKSFKLFK